MLTKKEKQNIEVEITNFQLYLNSLGKKLPSNNFVRKHTFEFFEKILGYHDNPINFKPPPSRDKYASLLFIWNIFILHKLESFNESSFKKINKNNNEINPLSLNELKKLIEEIKS